MGTPNPIQDQPVATLPFASGAVLYMGSEADDVQGCPPSTLLSSNTGLLDSFKIYFNGSGSAIQAGLASNLSSMRYGGVITGWSIVSDQVGSISLDIKKGTPSGGTVSLASITASAHPGLSSVQVASSTTLTGWATTFAANDVLQGVVLSASTVTQATITIYFTRS